MILAERFQVGLDRIAAIHEDEADGIARQTADEPLGILNHRPNAPVQTRCVDWLLGRERVKFLCREAAVPGDLGQHCLRCDAGKLAHRRA